MVIGIDIGGTKITGVVYSNKKVVRDLTVVMPNNLRDFEKVLLKLVDFLSAGYKISAVGVGMAGLIDGKKGTVVYSPNIKFIKNLNLVKFLRLNGISRVKLDNDANCFTRGVLEAGEGRKLNNFLVLTLGTGIGGGIVINKKIYRGLNDQGGELGHALINHEYFESAYQQLRNRKDFKGAGRVIGRGLASLTNIFAPQAIIIGGGYGHNEAKKYLPSAKSEMKKFLFNKNSKTKVLISNLNNAGALGAALLVA